MKNTKSSDQRIDDFLQRRKLRARYYLDGLQRVSAFTKQQYAQAPPVSDLEESKIIDGTFEVIGDEANQTSQEITHSKKLRQVGKRPHVDIPGVWKLADVLGHYSRYLLSFVLCSLAGSLSHLKYWTAKGERPNRRNASDSRQWPPTDQENTICHHCGRPFGSITE